MRSGHPAAAWTAGGARRRGSAREVGAMAARGSGPAARRACLGLSFAPVPRAREARQLLPLRLVLLVLPGGGGRGPGGRAPGGRGAAAGPWGWRPRDGLVLNGLPPVLPRGHQGRAVLPRLTSLPSAAGGWRAGPASSPRQPPGEPELRRGRHRLSPPPSRPPVPGLILFILSRVPAQSVSEGQSMPFGPKWCGRAASDGIAPKATGSPLQCERVPGAAASPSLLDAPTRVSGVDPRLNCGLLLGWMRKCSPDSQKKETNME